MMVKYSQIIFSSLMIILLTDFDGAALAAQHQSGLLKKLQKITARPEQRSRAIDAGEERALICGYCHGNDGNSIRTGVPNLAGQNPDYLLQQVGLFASGERKDFVMNSLAAKFTEDDQINLAIFYASKKVKAARGNQAKTAQGKALYQQQCQVCHGNSGRGNAGFARLAGQKATYIKMTLERFRDSSQGKTNHNKRSSRIMDPVASRLTDRQIQDLAAYITGM